MHNVQNIENTQGSSLIRIRRGLKVQTASEVRHKSEMVTWCLLQVLALLVASARLQELRQLR